MFPKYLTDPFRPQLSHRIDAYTRRNVSRGNSFFNWPTDVRGLLVIQFERPSQSWLGKLSCIAKGGSKPLKLKYKICAFEHRI